jgi:HSP20 family protein
MDTLTRIRSLSPFLGDPFTDETRSLWERLLSSARIARSSSWNPDIDVIDKPEAYVVKAEVPGLKTDEIKITLTGGTLTLEGEKKEEKRQEEEHFRHVERSHGRFERTFTFPTAVNEKNVEADLNDGILVVRIMKASENKPTKIKIHSS